MGSHVSTAEPTSPGAGLTAKERWNNIEQFTNEYFQYLSIFGGVVLTVETRLQVAQMALDALKCPGCASFSKDACLRKGCHIYETLASLDTHGSASNANENVLCQLVHSIINHQGRLTEAWYQTTLEKLDECGWIDETVAPTESMKRSYLLYSLFSEIVLVATMVHSLNTIFLIMGSDMPYLPQESPTATPPSLFDWSLAIKPGNAPQTMRCWAPFLTASQVNSKSPPFSGMDPEMKRYHLKYAMTSRGPLGAANWSLVDVSWALRMQSLLYVEMKDVVTMYRPLSPETRCAQSFSRRDAEVVATAIAQAYNCAF
jgi:hypothetical protein